MRQAMNGAGMGKMVSREDEVPLEEGEETKKQSGVRLGKISSFPEAYFSHL